MRDALMAASYAISLMLPLRLLSLFFSQNPKLTLDDMIADDMEMFSFSQPQNLLQTSSPAQLQLHLYIIQFNTSSNDLLCHQEIRCDVGFYEFPNPKSELI